MRRIRQCNTCGNRWATVEISAEEWKHRKTIRALASALAQAIVDPRQVYQDEAGTRVTIIIESEAPGAPTVGVK